MLLDFEIHIILSYSKYRTQLSSDNMRTFQNYSYKFKLRTLNIYILKVTIESRK